MLHRLFVCLLAAAMLGGCGMLPRHEADEARSARIAYALPEGQSTPGAIYQAGREISYFEDLKARRVGDTLTIRLQETTNASKSSSTETKKDSSTAITPPIIAGRPVTVNGTQVLENSVEGTREFSGEGSSSQSNQLVGSITVTVVDQLPNGNLVVEGEKWVTLNQGDELIRISGVVRPYDIAPDNTVTSDKVAEARIRYSGRGALASANKQGWLSRFFNSALFPY